jgi:hypothetical protein
MSACIKRENLICVIQHWSGFLCHKYVKQHILGQVPRRQDEI